MSASQKRIEELVRILNKANIDYFKNDNPSLGDNEYDHLLQELKRLEEEHPKFLSPNSPTQKVGGFVSEKFEKVIHKQPMLSLNNAFSADDLRKFDERIQKEYPNPTYSCELKIDGLAVNLEYIDGKLNVASTRGDGQVGENITENIKTIKTLPHQLSKPLSFEVRGEVYMPKKSFEKLNEERKANEEMLFQNPRNAAAGTLRQLDSKIVAKRNLNIFLYNLVDAKDYNYQHEVLALFEELGLNTNPLGRIVKNVEEMIAYVSEFERQKNELDYEIDGIVIKVNELKAHETIGYTSKHPKWAIAYKFQAEQATTKILGITFQVGRTGSITPVCELEPVFLSGSTIKRATLHNEDYCKLKDIRIGASVVIQKAGDVIPEVAETIKDEEFYQLEAFTMINNCPSCDFELVKKDAEHFCLNKSCPEKELASLRHFCERNAMNIESMGEKILEQFYEKGFLKNIFDIYELKNRYEELIELPGLGVKSIQKILDNVESSKNNSLDKLLFGLGIRNVGAKAAKVLAKSFRSLERLSQATAEELNAIMDIGEIISFNVTIFFQENPAIIEKIKSYGINTVYDGVEIKTDHFFSGKSVVITGTLENIKRNELTETLENLGAKVLNSVSKKLDFLICGKEAGTKLDKAKEFGVRIIEEEELKGLIV
ncbi:MAG: NAD-dependent DNA ligase LigA [Erysipelotrichales bacterium]|nr:NAD-dependent DNA ligase LigA [Erysipelotrichales bacterium]